MCHTKHVDAIRIPLKVGHQIFFVLRVIFDFNCVCFYQLTCGVVILDLIIKPLAINYIEKRKFVPVINSVGFRFFQELLSFFLSEELGDVFECRNIRVEVNNLSSKDREVSCECMLHFFGNIN